MTLATDVQSLEPGTLISLFEIDLSPAGFPSEPILRFYPGTEADYGDVVFAGNTYSAFPVTVSGFEMTSDGPMPRPTMTASNVAGAMTAQLRQFNDFLGAKVTRIRTFSKYLDSGASPDGTAKVIDIFYVEQKKSENKNVLQLELTSAIDLMDKQLPGRIMVANMCPWYYKGLECGWPGTDPAKWFDADDQQVFNSSQDQCSKLLTGCQLRFGEDGELPYGGWPAIGRTR
jgi:lambda family phage minor tail protein L